MTFYELPTSLTVGGVERKIRSDFRAVLDVLISMNDPDLNEQAKTEVLIKIMYPGWRDIPTEHLEEAVQKACAFIDCGQKDDGKHQPRLIDWEQDATLIIPAVNKVACAEVRAIPNLHWWTFFSYFMEIGDSTISTVIHIREKRALGKKLEKWEQEFYKKNKDIIQISNEKKRDEEELKALRELFGFQ